MSSLPIQSSGFVNPSGMWLPDLFGHQWTIFNSRKNFILLSGSRLSGKTTGGLFKIVRHLWETKNARVAFFAKSVKLAKDGGPWQDLIEVVIPQWIEGCDGFDYTTFDSQGTPGPKQDAQTRTAYFRIRNWYGGESEAKLFSIDNDNEIEAKIKSKSFSFIFFSELSMFKDPKLVPITVPSLRMPHLKPWDHWHQWMADTNPDIELGARSWFYKLFYEKKLGKKTENAPELKMILDRMEVIEMFMEDNPHLDPIQIASLKAFCADNPALNDSYVLGIHGDGGLKLGKLFAPLFNIKTHVVGSQSDEEGDQCEVHEHTMELHTGWDVGTTNHAAVILEKWYRLVEGKPKVAYSVLDELVVLGEMISLDEFTQKFLAKMDFLETKYKKKFKWYHWADNSALNVYRPSSGSYDFMEIQASSNDRIQLMGAVKPKGSIDARVRIMKLLLRENRIFVSARCPYTIAMLEKARRGAPETFSHEGEDFELPSKEPILRDEHKHTFDAITYPIYMESVEELLLTSTDRPNAIAKEQDEGMIISLPMD